MTIFYFSITQRDLPQKKNFRALCQGGIFLFLYVPIFPQKDSHFCVWKFLYSWVHLRFENTLRFTSSSGRRFLYSWVHLRFKNAFGFTSSSGPPLGEPLLQKPTLQQKVFHLNGQMFLKLIKHPLCICKTQRVLGFQGFWGFT